MTDKDIIKGYKEIIKEYQGIIEFQREEIKRLNSPTWSQELILPESHNYCKGPHKTEYWEYQLTNMPWLKNT